VTLADRLNETTVGVHGPRCTICRWLVDLPGGDSRTLAEALHGAYTSKQIAQALTAEGYTVSQNTVARHRRGECRGVS
jgi:hypothetical protein